MLNDFYRFKTILITGNTGFKGSWLSHWLISLGAKVVGYSKDIPGDPSLFSSLALEDKIAQHYEDIRDLDALKSVIEQVRPDLIFHLAAQPIVSESYKDPKNTITTNTIGMMNLCEALRNLDWSCNCVLITSDKVYDNVEWVWGYRENDQLGGKDIYSGSKGAAELIANSYLNSFSNDYYPNVNIGIARAGNVIGGGDWAMDRLVVDCFKSWSKNQTVMIRSPMATRPWQHVLEPLSGYLVQGFFLSKDKNLFGEAFNFGPSSDQNRTVLEVLNDLAQFWKPRENDFELYNVANNVKFKEAGLLKLNCDKALQLLSWLPTLNYHETISMTGEWYNAYYNQSSNIEDLTSQQIQQYCETANLRKMPWMV